VQFNQNYNLMTNGSIANQHPAAQSQAQAAVHAAGVNNVSATPSGLIDAFGNLIPTGAGKQIRYRSTDRN
jgi:hypothetical protein